MTAIVDLTQVLLYYRLINCDDESKGIEYRHFIIHVYISDISIFRYSFITKAAVTAFKKSRIYENMLTALIQC